MSSARHSSKFTVPKKGVVGNFNLYSPVDKKAQVTTLTCHWHLCVPGVGVGGDKSYRIDLWDLIYQADSIRI